MLSRKRKLQKKSRGKTKKHKKPRKIRRKKTKAVRKYKRKKTRRRKKKMKGGEYGPANYNDGELACVLNEGLPGCERILNSLREKEGKKEGFLKRSWHALKRDLGCAHKYNIKKHASYSGRDNCQACVFTYDGETPETNKSGKECVYYNNAQQCHNVGKVSEGDTVITHNDCASGRQMAENSQLAEKLRKKVENKEKRTIGKMYGVKQKVAKKIFEK